MVESMQILGYPTLLLGSVVFKVVKLMQSYINPTLILKSYVFNYHLLFTTTIEHSKQGALFSPKVSSLQTLRLFPYIGTI